MAHFVSESKKYEIHCENEPHCSCLVQKYKLTYAGNVDSHTFAWYDYFIHIYGGIAPITVKEYAIYYGDAKHGNPENGIPMLIKEREAKLSYDGTHYTHDTRFQRNRTVNTMDDKGEMVEYPIGGYYFVVITDASGQTFTSDIIHRD